MAAVAYTKFTFLLPIFYIFFINILLHLLSFFHQTHQLLQFLKTKKKKITPNYYTFMNYTFLIFLLDLISKKDVDILNEWSVNFEPSKLAYFTVIFSFFFIPLTSVHQTKNNPVSWKNTQYQFFLFVPVTTVLFFVLMSRNFTIFIFLLEVMTYLFYFHFFFMFNKKNKNTKFINLLITYYWNSFFGTSFLFYFLIKLLQKYNTTDFRELLFFKNSVVGDRVIFCFFLLGFFVKIGALGVHLLKADLYKNLRIDAIVLFSFFSIFVYILMLNHVYVSFFNKFIFFKTTLIFLNFFLYFFTVATTLYTVQNFLFFFAVSAVLTATTLILLIL